VAERTAEVAAARKNGAGNLAGVIKHCHFLKAADFRIVSPFNRVQKYYTKTNGSCILVSCLKKGEFSSSFFIP
jgi:hypothetical protein